MTADETRESGVEEVLARVLTEHDDVSFDLGTPREYTRHGGWNMSCQCGHPIGDGGDDAEAMGNHRAHVAAAQAAALAPVLAAERAKALRDAADQCERDGSRPVTRLLGSLACHVLGWCRDWLEAVDNAREWDGYEPDGWLGAPETGRGAPNGSRPAPGASGDRIGPQIEETRKR